MAQYLGFCAFIAKGPSSIPGCGTKILKAAQCSQKKKKKKGRKIALTHCFNCCINLYPFSLNIVNISIFPCHNNNVVGIP